MSNQQKIQLILKWSDWFVKHTNHYTESLARSLAYLWPAIASNQQIEVAPQSSIVQLLKLYKVPSEDEIWQYIDIRS